MAGVPFATLAVMNLHEIVAPELKKAQESVPHPGIKWPKAGEADSAMEAGALRVKKRAKEAQKG